MKRAILFLLLSTFFLSCSRKELKQKPICEEVNCVEEVKIEARHHSRW
jgi:hypothetical protein